MTIRSKRPNPLGLRVVASAEDWARHRYPTMESWEVALMLAELHGMDERAAERRGTKPPRRDLKQLCLMLPLRVGRKAP